MLDVDSLTQIGIGGVCVWALVKNSERFIGFISLQEKSFTKLLGNHINHNTKALNANDRSNKALAVAIDELIKYLKK